MLAERRIFEGRLPLAALSRLVPSLADSEGEAAYRLVFDTDAVGGGVLNVSIQAPLHLVCQRTLETFEYPVKVDTRLGLIDNERQEAGLPEGVEPLLLEDGKLRPAAVIEDELMLALPLVPVKPGSRLPDYDAGEASVEETDEKSNPFAVLGKLKQNT